MILQDITYLNLEFSDIKNPLDFFQTGGSVSEMGLLKTLYNNIKLTWKIENNDIKMSLSTVNKVYRFTLLNKRNIFGFLIYIPDQKRIDLYTSENLQIPLIQWKKRKIVYKTYPLLLEKLGIEKLLEKIPLVL